MSEVPNCPKCGGEFTYFDGSLYVFPDCMHEFSAHEEDAVEENTPEAVVCKIDGSSIVLKICFLKK